MGLRDCPPLPVCIFYIERVLVVTLRRAREECELWPPGVRGWSVLPLEARGPGSVQGTWWPQGDPRRDVVSHSRGGRPRAENRPSLGKRVWGPVRWPGDVAALGAQPEETRLQLEDLQAELRSAAGRPCPARAPVCGQRDAGAPCFQTLQYLQQNAKERAELAASAAASSTTSFGAPATASKISMQELEELRKQLGSVATGPTWQQVSRWPQCWRVETCLGAPALGWGPGPRARGSGQPLRGAGGGRPLLPPALQARPARSPALSPSGTWAAGLR